MTMQQTIFWYAIAHNYTTWARVFGDYPAGIDTPSFAGLLA